MTGIVTNVRNDRGYFFILGDDGQTYFSVFGNIMRDNGGYRPFVHVGSKVRFRVEESTKKHSIAVKVYVREE